MTRFLTTEGSRGALRRIAALAVFFALCAPALAHHILGIPHYAYDEQYPQTPVLTYRVVTGAYELKMTGYPGVPKPGERCFLNVYIRRIDDGAAFDGLVTLQAMRDSMIGEDPVIYGPAEAEREDAVFKFYPEFEDEANYTVRIEYTADGEPWTIDFPMVVGEPGSPWAVLGGIAAGVILFLIVVRAARIKRRRALAAAGGAFEHPDPDLPGTSPMQDRARDGAEPVLNDSYPD